MPIRRAIPVKSVFAGHNQYDTLVDTFTSTGYGGDAQIGFHVPFFRNSEVFLGGYYFAPKDTDSIGGGAVRVQIPVNRYLSVIASEAYDSEYHNTAQSGFNHVVRRARNRLRI